MDKDVHAQVPPSPSTGGAKAQAAVSPQQQLIGQLADSSKDGSAGILAQLSSNPFFTAGFGLAALGTGLSLAQKGARQAATLLRRRLLVDLEITRHDPTYASFLHWVTAYQRAQLAGETEAAKDTSLVGRLANKFLPGLHHLSVQSARIEGPGGSSHSRFALVPGLGRHVLRYGKAFIAISRERENSQFDPQGRPFETIKLTTLYAHRRVFEQIILEADQISKAAEEGKTRIFTPAVAKWELLGQPKRKRPLASVILAEGVKESTVADVENFLGAREWYLDRGIPYRRGYLLFGTPGTGKSSFIQALAGHLDFNLAMLSLSQRGLTDDSLMRLLLEVPPRTFVVLEDADAAFANKRTQTDDDGYRGANVTYSGLLNALDGVGSAEERIVFLTTNHIERLDAALVRPGRVDMTVRLGEATPWQIEHLWDRFYQEFDKDGSLKKQYVQRLADFGLIGKVSTALLQGHFLFNKDHPQGAIATVDQMASTQQRLDAT